MSKESFTAMSSEEKLMILSRAHDWFGENIAASHIERTKQLTSLDKFKINPFTVKYLAQFAFGNTEPESLAKALLFPRVLGTSIATIVGDRLQKFCHEVLDGLASLTSGIDIAFEDRIDGRRKWCQLKAGPETLNKDDVQSITGHFKDIKGLARANKVQMNSDTDCVVGVMYGTKRELNSFYKQLDEQFPVYVGSEFWTRLTGDTEFYEDLIQTFSRCASDYSAESTLADTIADLAAHIRTRSDGI